MKTSNAYLIVKMSSLGDILQCFDLPVYLKARDPSARVDWVVEKRFEEIVKLHPCVDEVISIDIKGIKKHPFSKSQEIKLVRKKLQTHNYQAAFDLQGNIKSSLVMMLVKAKDKVGFSFKQASEWISSLFVNRWISSPKGLTITKHYLNLLQSYFDEIMDWDLPCYRLKLPPLDPIKCSTFIMVCPGSNWRSKQLKHSTLVNFLKFIDRFTKQKIVLVWNKKEECLNAKDLESISSIEECYGMNLSKWASLMQHAELVVSVDSAALHLAAVLGKPTFSMFGPSSRGHYQPQGHFHMGVEGECPFNVHFVKRCPHLRTCKSYACIEDLSLNLMKDVFKRLYSQVKVKCLLDEDPQLRTVDQNQRGIQQDQSSALSLVDRL